jgi:hypothetical protein
MVIFGAGASYDSATGAVTHIDGPPPLAQQLFTNRRVFNEAIAKYGVCRPLVGELRALAEQEHPPALEDVLADMTKRADHNMETKRQLLALRFYLREAIANHTQGWIQDITFTNYGRLLRRIGDWRQETGERVALVTFNYDLMLDSALVDQIGQGDPFTEPARYVSRTDWQLCKLHGSTNWWRKMPIADPGLPFDNASTAIGMGHELNLGGGEVVRAGIPDGPWHPVESDGRAALYVPALAVPTTGKSTFETHPSHVEAFDAAVPQVDRLLIVGWRGMEDHVLERLKMTPHYSLGIADPAAEHVYNRLGRAFMHDLGNGRNRNAANSAVRTVTWNAFSELLRGDAVDKWLRIPLPTNSFANTHLMTWDEYERRVLPLDQQLAASG